MDINWVLRESKVGEKSCSLLGDSWVAKLQTNESKHFILKTEILNTEYVQILNTVPKPFYIF